MTDSEIRVFSTPSPSPGYDFTSICPNPGDAEGEVQTWTKNNPILPTPQRFDLGYDNADQLLTAPLKNASTNALIKQYTYVYDTAANRTSELVGTTTTTSTPNSVNEITNQSGGVNRTLTYDPNGSLINDGSARTFEWDGANRLVAVNYTATTNRSEFSYDGSSRVAKIVEKTAGTIISTRKFVWCGMEKCEFRNAFDAVTLRVYPQGQHTGTAGYFFTRDHLGSVREMFNSTGGVVARYDYDPYGRSTVVTMFGSTPPDFNFTGLYRHSKSNLDLATYRAYDPDLGRWLSRDPIAEEGGLNLYDYVRNNPVNLWDPLGLYWAERYAGYGATAGFVLTLGGSIVVDASTGGLNILATPMEIAGGTALVGAIGYGFGSFLDRVTGRTGEIYVNQEIESDAVDGGGKACPAGELTPTGETRSGPSTRKGNKGGTNVQEGYVDSQGRPVTRQTVYGPDGKIVHGPHYRPGGPK